MDGPILSFLPMFLDLADAGATAVALCTAWSLVKGGIQRIVLRAERTRAVERFLARARRQDQPRRLPAPPSGDEVRA